MAEERLTTNCGGLKLLEDEFDLSKFRQAGYKNGVFAYPEENIKEFIKLEGYLLQAFIQEEITWEEMCDKRLKLIGEKLR